MKKMALTLLTIFISILLFANNPENYFREKSVLYTFSSLLKFKKGINESPQVIAHKIGYKEPHTQKVDYYILLIIKKYKLNMTSITINDNNLSRVNSKLDSFMKNNGNPVVVTYYKAKKSHCASIAGARYGKDGNIKQYIVFDSALQKRDFITIPDLKSKYWNLQVKSLYFFKD